MAQVELLQRLADEPGMRVSELAARHRLAPNTVSNLVQQMVQAGLVRRDVDARDRRAVTLAATAEGLRQLEGWSQANSRRIEAAMGALTVAERRAITGALPALSRLVRTLEELSDGRDDSATDSRDRH